MPTTTLIWNDPTSRPRHFAGAISAMYIGPSTEEPPMPRPPMKRATTSAGQFHAKAQPRAEIRYSTAISRKLSRRPYRSPGMPASMAPNTVPKSALKTVNPSDQGESWNVTRKAPMVPAITAVSNPNSRPPKAATTVLFKRYEFSFINAHTTSNDLPGADGFEFVFEPASLAPASVTQVWLRVAAINVWSGSAGVSPAFLFLSGELRYAGSLIWACGQERAGRPRSQGGLQVPYPQLYNPSLSCTRVKPEPLAATGGKDAI